MAGSSGAGEFALQIGDGAAAGAEVSGGTRDGHGLGRAPELTAWVTKQIAEARSSQTHSSQSNLEYQGGRVSVKFETLTFQGHSTSSDDMLHNTGSAPDTSAHDTSAPDTADDTSDREARYAVIVSSIENAIPEGASLITRQQWHDIKNHLGGLKLYATFLKKKTPDGDDQAIVEKMLNGINGLIDHLAQIRGGDAK